MAEVRALKAQDPTGPWSYSILTVTDQMPMESPQAGQENNSTVPLVIPSIQEHTNSALLLQLAAANVRRVRK